MSTCEDISLQKQTALEPHHPYPLVRTRAHTPHCTVNWKRLGKWKPLVKDNYFFFSDFILFSPSFIEVQTHSTV